MGQDRCFASADAQGGKDIDPQTTALVMIEFQVRSSSSPRARALAAVRRR